MVDRQRDDEWIAEKLKAEAGRYEPDLERIRQRIRERGEDLPARRSSWLFPAAAAACVVLTAGVFTALHNGPARDLSGRVQVVAPGWTESAVSASPPTAAASPTAPNSTLSETDSEPGTQQTAVEPTSTSEGSSGGTSGNPGVSSPDVQLELAAAASGAAVTLPGGAVDWIAAGSGSAVQTIRRKQGDQLISGPHETGNAVSTMTNGPFSVSWTGGMAESSQDGSRRWRTVTAPVGGPETGLVFRAPATKRSATLVLYVGAGSVDGQLRTQLGGQAEVTRTRVRAVAGSGYVATIRYRTTSGQDQLTVTLIAGSGGSVSFAAVVLR